MKATDLRAFHGQQEIKDKYLVRVRAHIAADELIHGRYWENGKGCAVGCTIHSGDHSAYERELGIPRILARIEDGIFESLPNGLSKKWPGQFLSAINVGADLSLVWPRFAVWLLTDEKHGVIQFAKTAKTKTAIQNVSDAYQSVVDGAAAEIDWRKLRTYAASYAYAAASYAYAASYAAYAAYAASYAYAAAYAAYAAYAADAASYPAAAATTRARTSARKAQANKLLELLAAERGSGGAALTAAPEILR